MQSVGGEGDIDADGYDRSDHIEEFHGSDVRRQQLALKIPVPCDDMGGRLLWGMNSCVANVADDALDPAVAPLAR